MAAMTGPLVAVDWGTSSLRGALIAADGTVREERSDARGILAVPSAAISAPRSELVPQSTCLLYTSPSPRD